MDALYEIRSCAMSLASTRYERAASLVFLDSNMGLRDDILLHKMICHALSANMTPAMHVVIWYGISIYFDIKL